MPVFEAFRLALQTIRAQKLKSGFPLLGVFIGVASLIAAWSIVNGVNRYMTEKFAQTLYGVNTFQLRRRPMFAAPVHQVQRCGGGDSGADHARRHGLAVGR